MSERLPLEAIEFIKKVDQENLKELGDLVDQIRNIEIPTSKYEDIFFYLDTLAEFYRKIGQADEADDIDSLVQSIIGYLDQNTSVPSDLQEQVKPYLKECLQKAQASYHTSANEYDQARQALIGRVSKEGITDN